MTDGLTDAQRELADARAQAVLAITAAHDRASGDFLCIRDTRLCAKQAGIPFTDWRVERDMVRDAGFGRFKASGILGDWETMVAAADEASRHYHEPIDLIEVSRRSLAWLLAGRPEGPMYDVREHSRRVATDEIHIEQAGQMGYRQLLDAWRALGVGAPR